MVESWPVLVDEVQEMLESGVLVWGEEDDILHRTDNRFEVFVLLNREGVITFQKDGEARPKAAGGVQHEVRFSARLFWPRVRAEHVS